MSFELPRLPSTGLTSQPPERQQIWWQEVVEAIEGQINDLALAISSLSEVAPLTFTADYQGAIDPANQLPYEVALKRYNGDTDVTTESTWSISGTTGDITASIGAATGILSITAVGTSGTITVSSSRNAIVKTRLVSITKTIAAPPTTSGGGTGGGSTSSDTSFNSINSTTHAAITDELTVTVSSSGVVALSAVLTVRTSRSAPTGVFPVFGKWEWWDGAAWVTANAAEVESAPDAEVSLEEGIYVLDTGSLTVNTSKSGLAASSSQKFRLMARNSSGTRVMTFTGTASAVP